jgi:surface protein
MIASAPLDLSQETNYVIAIYNETSPSTERQILGSGFDITQVQAIYVDGHKISNTSTYTFSTAGEHTVVIKMVDKFSSMASMFQQCQYTSIDLSNLDASWVTAMAMAFQGCNSLTSIDLSGLDTHNVSNMSYMFMMCNKLTSIDLSEFDTSHATDTSYMFYWCPKLKVIDLSNCDLSKVVNMNYMFYFNAGLTNIFMSGPLNSNLVTPTQFTNGSSGTFFYDDEYDYSKLIGKLPSSWGSVGLSNTIKASFAPIDMTNIRRMLCIEADDFIDKTDEEIVEALFGIDYIPTMINLDATYFDRIWITDDDGVYILKSDLNNIVYNDSLNMYTVQWPDGTVSDRKCLCKFTDGAKTDTHYSPFQQTVGLKAVNLSKFHPTWYTSTATMMASCFTHPDIDISSLDFTKLNIYDGTDGGDIENMFIYNIGAENITMKIPSSIKSMTMTFFAAYTLKNLKLVDSDTSGLTKMNTTFAHNYLMTELDLSDFDMSNVTYMRGCFSQEDSLKILKLGRNRVKSSIDCNYMFEYTKTNGVLHYPAADETNWADVISAIPSTWTAKSY